MGVETLLKRLEKMAEEEERRILKEAEERVRARRLEAERELESFREVEERKFKRERDRVRNLILSSGRKKSREMVSSAKEELIWEVISQLKERLRNLEGERYMEWVRRVISEGESLVVRDCYIFPVREVDFEWLKGEYGERVRTSLFSGDHGGLPPKVAGLVEEYRREDLLGGVLLISRDGSVIGDYTLLGRISRRKEEIRERISKKLFGKEAI